MKPYIGVGLSVGVLAGIWTQVSVESGLITWVAFVAWACFFAAGGGALGFRKGLAANLSGVIYGWLVALLITVADFPGVLAVGIAVAALAMCLLGSTVVHPGSLRRHRSVFRYRTLVLAGRDRARHRCGTRVGLGGSWRPYTSSLQ